MEDMMKTFLLIAAIISLVFGVGMVLLPYQIVSLYGTQLDVSGQFMARYFGSALLGLAIIFYLMRGAMSLEGLLKTALLGGLVWGVFLLIVSIWDALAGTHNALVWLNVALGVFFTVGFGYFYFRK